MKRITPEQAISIFRDGKFYPIQGGYFDKTNGRCLVGAISNEYLYTPNICEIRNLKYPSAYVTGMELGWDGLCLDQNVYSAAPEERDLYRQGFLDGRAAWEAVSKVFGVGK